MRRQTAAARLAACFASVALIGGCAAGTRPSPTPTPMPTRSPALVAPSASPSQEPTSSGTVTSEPLVTGWPVVTRAGVTLTGLLVDERPPFEGAPGPVPAVKIAITITGLALGESVLLTGSGAYDFAICGCGVQPNPCQPGSDTTDPTVHLCRPEYAQAAEGTAATAAQATAQADGTAAATLRFVVSQSERVCPAGPSRPWYVESGQWKLNVTDNTHGLRLAPPDLVIGP